MQLRNAIWKKCHPSIKHTKSVVLPKNFGFKVFGLEYLFFQLKAGFQNNGSRIENLDTE
jgi:hypothetical protein